MKYRRFLLPLAGVAAVLALSIPFVFWYQTWFGRPLSDEEMARDLDSDARPRDTQHALTQLASIMERGDSGTQRWYPRIAALSRHPNVQIRMMAAWVMGQDNQAGVLHEALLKALDDSDAMVRRNAALALVRFGDDGGRAELLDILRSGADEQQVWEALRGLYLTGRPEDLIAVEEYRRKAGSASAAIRAQAEITAQAIRARSVGVNPAGAPAR